MRAMTPWSKLFGFALAAVVGTGLPAHGAEPPPDLLVGYTELRTDLAGGRHANVAIMRAAVVKAGLVMKLKTGGRFSFSRGDSLSSGLARSALTRDAADGLLAACGVGVRHEAAVLPGHRSGVRDALRGVRSEPAV